MVSEVILLLILGSLVIDTGDLGNVYQTPCVVFAGHPSLRCGDAVHFMEAWGSSSKNSVIFTGERERKRSDVFSNIMCVHTQNLVSIIFML